MKMRMLYVIVLIFSHINAQNDHIFCDETDADKIDYCPNKIIQKSDYTWTADNHFNNRKAVCTSAISIEVDLLRGLYIENTAEKITLIPVKKENCKKVLTRINNNYGLEEVASKNLIELPAKSKHLVSVFEPECRLIAKIPKNEKIYHVFMRNLKTEEFDKIFQAGKDVELGNYIFSEQNTQQEDMNEENVPYETKEVNKFFKYPEELNKKKNCQTNCKNGRRFAYKRNAGLPFANKFIVDDICEWMTIHISHAINVDGVPDYKVFAAEISFRHGFVTLPKEVKAFPMDLEKYEVVVEVGGKNTAKKSGYEVTVGYSGKNGKSFMVIANAHGQALRTRILMGSTDDISFAFSHDKCLKIPIGAEITDEHKFKGFPFDEELNIAYRVAQVDGYIGESYYEGVDDTTEEDNRQYKYEGAQKTFEDTKNEGGTSKDVINNGVEKETLKPVVKVDAVTTAPAKTYVMREEDRKKIEEEQEIKREREKAVRDALKDNKQHYKYWGIPAGFSVGSFSSFLICNIIMFIFKRSVLTFWYKAMYKRYGSDTTMGAGTTMGKTVGGETIGGATTVGGTTAGGETTGSTTAA